MSLARLRDESGGWRGFELMVPNFPMFMIFFDGHKLIE